MARGKPSSTGPRTSGSPREGPKRVMFFVTGLRVTKTVHAEESCRSWKSPDKAPSARRGGVCVRRLSGVCFCGFLEKVRSEMEQKKQTKIISVVGVAYLGAIKMKSPNQFMNGLIPHLVVCRGCRRTSLSRGCRASLWGACDLQLKH